MSVGDYSSHGIPNLHGEIYFSSENSAWLGGILGDGIVHGDPGYGIRPWRGTTLGNTTVFALSYIDSKIIIPDTPSVQPGSLSEARYIQY